MSSTMLLVALATVLMVAPKVMASSGSCYCDIGFANKQTLTPFDGETRNPGFQVPDGKSKLEITAMEYDNRSDACRFKVVLGMRNDDFGDIYLAYIQFFYGVHASNNKKYHRQVKIGTNVTIYGEGINDDAQGGEQVTLPWMYDEGGVDVVVSEMGIVSSACQVQIMYPGCSTNPQDRRMMSTVASRAFSPGYTCGTC